MALSPVQDPFFGFLSEAKASLKIDQVTIQMSLIANSVWNLEAM